MSAATPQWYHINNAGSIDSPALIVYKERALGNIRALINRASDISLLRPHVKTNKMAEVCAMMIREGITKFKCATIAEAEMLGSIGAPDVLLAYQPVGPKVSRLLQLVKKFRATKFSCVVDSVSAAKEISAVFHSASEQIAVYIDLNVGMNRTGIKPNGAMELIASIKDLPGIDIIGLHAYDGQIADDDIAVRRQQCEAIINDIHALSRSVNTKFGLSFKIVAGGSPTFFVFAQQQGFECSPGTFVFWDWSYKKMMPEERYEWAALVMTRVVSIIDEQTICTDLGHKSVAAEKPQPRVLFLNATDVVPKSQSEEHLVLTVPDASKFSVGDVLYSVPMHICPTVALYERAIVVEKNTAVTEWEVTARDKKITI